LPVPPFPEAIAIDLGLAFNPNPQLEDSLRKYKIEKNWLTILYIPFRLFGKQKYQALAVMEKSRGFITVVSGMGDFSKTFLTAIPLLKVGE
jgi:hypothetical protein